MKMRSARPPGDLDRSSRRQLADKQLGNPTQLDLVCDGGECRCRTLDQVVTIYTVAQAQLYRRNGTPVTATSTVALNIARLGLGFAGASTYVSCTGAYISEGWFWRDDIDATDRDELYSDQSVAFALS